jgi:hypothetical protein
MQKFSQAGEKIRPKPLAQIKLREIYQCINRKVKASPVFGTVIA